MTDTATPAASDAAPVVPSAVPAEAPKADAASPQEGAEVENKPDDRSGGNEDQSEEQKPRQKASERIGELYGRMKAMERERNAAIAEVERLRQPVVDPSQWDQMSYDQQQAAQVRQAVRQERADELAQEAQRRAMDADRARAEMFRQRVDAVRSQIKDIDVVLADSTLPVTEIGARFIAESEKGPHVAYWLAQNRGEAARIASLDPLSQAYELGRIEQRINAAPAARKVSQAPAPVPRVAGGANSGAKDPAAMTMDEYAAYYRKRGR
jgi:hypothetical protein